LSASQRCIDIQESIEYILELWRAVLLVFRAVAGAVTLSLLR
jgi:hypothetical protein